MKKNSAQAVALQNSMGIANHMLQSVNSTYAVHLNSINHPLEGIQNIINTMNSSKMIYELNSFIEKAATTTFVSDIISGKTTYSSLISDVIGDKKTYASVISDMIGDKKTYASLFSNLLTEISKSTQLYQNTFEAIQGIGLHELPLEEFRKFVDNDLNDFKQKQTPIEQHHIKENKHPRKRLITKTRKLIQNKEIQGKVSFYVAIYSFLCQLDPCNNSFSEYSKYIYLAIISLIVWFAEQKNYCDKN